MNFEALGLALDLCLGLLALSIAVFALRTRTTYAAVVGFVAFGLLMALAWFRLGAPDVALTEAAIGTELALMPGRFGLRWHRPALVHCEAHVGQLIP